MIKSEITDFWSIFEEPIGFRLFPAILSQNVSLGYDQSGNRSMFVDVPNEVHINEPNYSLEYLSFRVEKGPHKQLVISLKDDSFFFLFDEFIFTIFSQIEKIEDVGEVGKKIVELYHNWSLFFNKENRRQLKLKRILGLAGELYYIGQYLDSKVGVRDIIESWEGPTNRTHDFIFQDHDLEVKAKLESSNVVHISSLFQLEFDKVLRLGVVSFLLWEEGADGAPVTITNMIDDIVQKLKDQGRDPILFLNKLLQMGINFFDKEQMEFIDELQFVIEGVQEYDASHDDFPRIVSSTIPTGVSKVKYDLDLNLLEDFKI